MEVIDSWFRNKIYCAIKFCRHMDKITLETAKLMKETCKDGCCGDSVF